MFRPLKNLPAMAFAATLGLFALTSVLTAQPPVPPTTQIKPDDINRTQAENAKLYKQFADAMLRLAQKWEKSENPDERERAKALRAALTLAAEKGVDNLFKDLIKGLSGTPGTGEFNRIIGQDKKLVEALEEILRTLDTEDEGAKIKREIAELKKLIEEIEKHKRDQENLAARTQGKGDPAKIAKEQKELAERTQKTADKLGPEKKDGGNPSAGKDDKAETKPETKPGEASPEAKPDTKENKSDAKDPMPGMGMDPKGGGEPKPAPMGGMMDPKGGDKESPKDAGMPGDPKAGGEPKPGPMDPKTPPMGMMGEPKPMAGDAKAQGDGKGEPKPSEGQMGGEGKPMSGMPMPGMPMAGQPSQGKPAGGPPMGGGMPPMGGGMPPMGGMPPPMGAKDPAQENVQQAVPEQKGAEDDIKKNEPTEAGKKQDKAIDALQKALAELEKRLKQLREKELAKLLANLEERVGRMLRMQIEVYEATKKLDAGIIAAKGAKSQADIQKSQGEADKELSIVVEADKTLKLMEGEGSAVVFAGVLNQVKGDMEAVQKRLNEARVEKQTQGIEEDIIEQLTMMKDALKKAKQDLENKPPMPSEPKDANGKPPDKKLIDLINELKLVKSLQEQVNRRTIGYNKQDPGEQAKDTLIQGELKQLSDRQKVLQDMLHKIATQANQ